MPGLSASMMGFVLNSKLLIIAGALDGASGFDSQHHHVQGDEPQLHQCAVRRVRPDSAVGRRRRVRRKTVRSAGPEEVAQILEAAQSVIIIPGYGMAVAQAQHKVRELYDQLTRTGRQCAICHSSSRRPHARAHERAAGRGGDPLRPASWRWTRSMRISRRRTSRWSSGPMTW